MTSDTPESGEWSIDRRTVLRSAAATTALGLIGMSATGLAAAEEHCPDGCEAEPVCETEVPLCAGQNIEVGTVHVRRVPGEDRIEVEYVLDGETENDWYLAETHLYVGTTDPRELSSAPGQFPFSDSYGDGVTGDTFTIGFDEICAYELGGGNGKGGGGKWEQVADGYGVVEGDCVYVAAHAVVVEVITAAPYFAGQVVSYDQGVKKNRDPVDSDRSNHVAALEQEYPESPRADIGFFSLGFKYDESTETFAAEGGEIVVEFDCPLRNGDGDDLRIWEVTFGKYPEETADVYAWDDETGTWAFLGTADNSEQGPAGSHEALTVSDFDLDTAGLESTSRIRIVDTTDPSLHNSNADGFDLDGIQALTDCTREETAWGDGCDGCEITDGGNWATYFQYGIGETCGIQDIVGTITLSYEDLPQEGSDWDLNDWVVDLIGTFTSTGTNSDGAHLVNGFTFDIVPQARGAGDDHEWHMLFPGDVLCGSGSYGLIVRDNTGTEIRSSSGTFAGSSDVDVTVFPSTEAVLADLENAELPGETDGCTEPNEWATLSVSFDEPCAIDVPTAPADVGVNGDGLFFDPYLNNLAKPVEVHKGDVRLVAVPDDWQWPLGAVKIWNAYDEVESSGGLPVYTTDTWYEGPVDDTLVTNCDFDPGDLGGS